MRTTKGRSLTTALSWILLFAGPTGTAMAQQVPAKSLPPVVTPIDAGTVRFHGVLVHAPCEIGSGLAPGALPSLELSLVECDEALPVRVALATADAGSTASSVVPLRTIPGAGPARLPLPRDFPTAEGNVPPPLRLSIEYE